MRAPSTAAGSVNIEWRHTRVLEELTSRLSDEGVTWALTGSLAHRIQGVPVEVHDVDVQTDERGAYRIADVFRNEVVRKVRLRRSANVESHFGELVVHGISVEVMGALRKRLRDGSWEPPVDVAAHRVLVPCGSLEVPALSLRYEARAYEALGRAERAALLRRYCGDGQR